MERYITDEHGVRKSVILDIEDFQALVRAAEDADDIRGIGDVRRQIDVGDDEMLDYRDAREEWDRQGAEREP